MLFVDKKRDCPVISVSACGRVVCIFYTKSWRGLLKPRDLFILFWSLRISGWGEPGGRGDERSGLDWLSG